MKHLLFVAMIMFACSLRADVSPPKGIISVPPRLAPALSLENMDGKRVTMSAVPGRWSFVHFWASWCGPCRREMPAIQVLTHKLAQSEWDFYIVNTAESEDIIFSFLGSVAPEIDTLLDTDGLVTERWQPRGLPSTYLVDPAGNIRYVVIGGQDWSQREYQAFLLYLSKRDRVNTLNKAGSH